MSTINPMVPKYMGDRIVFSTICTECESEDLDHFAYGDCSKCGKNIPMVRCNECEAAFRNTVPSPCDCWMNY